MAITTLFLVFGVLVLVFILLMQIMALKKNEDNEADFQKMNQKLESKINELSENYAKESRQNREEMAKNIQTVNQTIHSQINDQGLGQLKQIADLSSKNEEAIERLRLTMDTKLESMRTNNEEKLDAMRKTVDEKLETTLNKRLGESFNLVNQRLEQVHKSLGEMQSLSTNLTDIKKIFTNVKSRGVWGEVQLGNILEEILAPNQYIANFAPKPKSDERVE
ncbi:MAG: DNA recombination protein RmuC, partial [Clostridiales bacterium]